MQKKNGRFGIIAVEIENHDCMQGRRGSVRIIINGVVKGDINSQNQNPRLCLGVRRSSKA